jgi:hypothetical protein
MMTQYEYRINFIWSDGALSNTQEVLDLLIQAYQAEGKTLPQP